MSVVDPTAARIAATQDAIMKAIRAARRETPAETRAARIAEQERVALTAESVGVSPEDYHKWASGRPMPEVAEKVKAFMSNR